MIFCKELSFDGPFCVGRKVNYMTIFSNKVYDVLKQIALIVLPALATLYGALAKTWGWPFVEEIVCTITAVDTFLGALLGVSTIQYKMSGGKNNEENG